MGSKFVAIFYRLCYKALVRVLISDFNLFCLEENEGVSRARRRSCYCAGGNRVRTDWTSAGFAQTSLESQKASQLAAA